MTAYQSAIPLNESKKGQNMRIHRLPKGSARMAFIRLGISEGELVFCYERLPGGTVVIRKKRQHLAIGCNLAKQILVVLIDERDAS